MIRRIVFSLLLLSAPFIYAADFFVSDISVSGSWDNIEERYAVIPDLEFLLKEKLALSDTTTADASLKFSILTDGIFFGSENSAAPDLEAFKTSFIEGICTIDILIRQFDIVFHRQNNLDIGVFGWRGDKLGHSTPFIQKNGMQLTNGPLYSRSNSAVTEYEGIHPVTGLGGYAGTKLEKVPFDLRLYAYTNSNAYVSFDGRCIFTSRQLLVDMFAGIAINGTSFTDNPLHFGLSGICSNKTGAELFIETGFTRFMVGDRDNYKNWYCFFEPRVQLGFVCLSMAFFHHPEYYDGKETNNGGAIDWNFIRVAFGNYLRYPTSGGIEITGRYLPAESPKLIITPFAAYKTEKYLWQAAFDLYPFGLHDDLKKSFNFSLSVKGVF